MKRALIVFALALLCTAPMYAQSQADSTAQAHDAFRKADARLNSIYQKMMPLLQGDEKKLLVDAQLHWVKFRDADAAARAEFNKGGTMYHMVYYNIQTEDTENRANQLETWLKYLQDHR